MTEPREVIRRRQPARPRADHEHPLAGGGRRRVEGPSPLQRQVAQEPLDRVDRNGAVELGTVADALARVVTDPPVNRRERVVGHQFTPRLLVTTRLRVRQPGLDVLPGRAAGVARGQEVDVDRAALPGRPGARAPVHAGRAAASRPAAARSWRRSRPTGVSQSSRNHHGQPTLSGGSAAGEPPVDRPGGRRPLRPQVCCDAVALNQLPGLTLGELLDGDLGLELVAGGEDARHRRVAGAHSIEIDHPADWLGRHWVMLTTGVRLRHRAGAQRQLVAELEEIGAAALGFGVEVAFKRVPPALLDEARSRGVPVFAIPLRTPFRDVVSAVNASLLSTEVRAMQRLSSLQLHLMDALEEDDPRRAVIERLAEFVDATVTLFSPDGRVLRTTGRAPTEAIWREITCRPAALMQFELEGWETIATPLRRDMTHGSWLAVSRGRVADRCRTWRARRRGRPRRFWPRWRASTTWPRRRSTRSGARSWTPCSTAMTPTTDRWRLARRHWVSTARRAGPRRACRLRRTLGAARGRRDGARTAVAALPGGHPAGCLRPARPSGAGGHPRRRRRGAGREPGRRRRRGTTGRRRRRHARSRCATRRSCSSARGPTRAGNCSPSRISTWRRSSPRSVSTERLKPKVDELIGTLARHQGLFDTVVAYFGHDLDVMRTSEAMGLHHNSLRYRLGRVEQVLGRSLKDPATIASLYIALAAHRHGSPSLDPRGSGRGFVEGPMAITRGRLDRGCGWAHEHRHPHRDQARRAPRRDHAGRRARAHPPRPPRARPTRGRHRLRVRGLGLPSRRRRVRDRRRGLRARRNSSSRSRSRCPRRSSGCPSSTRCSPTCTSRPTRGSLWRSPRPVRAASRTRRSRTRSGRLPLLAP